MEYKELVAVTGLGGLFQLITTKSDGAIVRNITDKTTKFISARLHNVTPLESIEIYTTTDNVRLHEVFRKMSETESSNTPADSKSDNNTIKKYFESIFPDFDYDRVYVSDMKKMLKWYELLKTNELLPKEEEKTEETTEAEVAAEEPAPAKEEAKPKAKTKKAAAPKTEAATEENTGDEEKKPAKKPRKKKTDQ